MNLIQARRQVRRGMLALGLLCTLLTGCTTIPTPMGAMRAVNSPAAWAQPQPATAFRTTGLQPQLLWHVNLPGEPNRLWWHGETLLATALDPSAFPWGERYLLAYDPQGRLLWRQDLAPGRLLDADLDRAGNAYLAIAGTGADGGIVSLDRAGRQRWTSPWRDAWPRSLRVSRDGRRTVVGFDGESGSYPGRLRVLGDGGVPAMADVVGRLSGFAGFPNADGQTLLMGYQGTDTGLFRNEPYGGIGVRLLDAGGRVLWAVVDYHRPLALSADGDLAVVAGVPSADRAYDPPPVDTQPAPPFGQLLWFHRAGQIAGRYRFPFAAGIRAFTMTPDGQTSAVALLSYRFAGERHARTELHLTWLGPVGRVVWEQGLPGELGSLSLSEDGGGLLVTQHLPGDPGDWLTLYDPTGKVVWRYHHTAALLAGLLAPDGQTAAVLAADGLWLFTTRRLRPQQE